MRNREVLTHGEVVIVRIPHQFKPTVTLFSDKEDAYKAYGLYEKLEKFSNWEEFRDCFESLEGSSAVEKYHESIRKAGINDNEPFYEYLFGSFQPEYFKVDKVDYGRLLQQAAADDMYSAHIFQAEENETWGEFADRIYKDTRRGHNAPSGSSIEYELGCDIDRDHIDSELMAEREEELKRQAAEAETAEREYKKVLLRKEKALEYAKGNLPEEYGKLQEWWAKADQNTGDKRKKYRKKANHLLLEIADRYNFVPDKESDLTAAVRQAEKTAFEENKKLTDFYDRTGIKNPNEALVRNMVEKEESKQDDLKAGTRDDSMFKENDGVEFNRYGNTLKGKIERVDKFWTGEVRLLVKADDGKSYWADTADITKHEKAKDEKKEKESRGFGR